jgi:hypothetical protein
VDVAAEHPEQSGLDIERLLEEILSGLEALAGIEDPAGEPDRKPGPNDPRLREAVDDGSGAPAFFDLDKGSPGPGQPAGRRRP